MLYGPNKKVGADGENAANYDNLEFNRLFERMKNMENGPGRLRIIQRMLDVVRRDAPWVWGYHPKQFVLQHTWVRNNKPNNMANNTLKYVRLDQKLRATRREKWNKHIVWPLGVFVGLLILGAVPAIFTYVRRERQK